MRSKDERLLLRIKRYIEECRCLRGRSPSCREVAAAVGCGKSTAQEYMGELAARGVEFIETAAVVAVPKLGGVPCGPLSEEFESVDGYIPLPESLVGRGEHYFLTARGDSMVGAGIDDGDLVLVRRCEEADDGDIVVALVDNEVTLKRLYRDAERGRVVLHPENPEMRDIIVSGCVICGVAVRVIKSLV